MSKHTKGPWEAHDGEVTTQQIDGRSYRRIAAVQDYGVGSEPEVDEANALLIAAAPDLLAACERVLSSLEYNLGTEFLPETRQVLREAITKATGEPSP